MTTPYMALPRDIKNEKEIAEMNRYVEKKPSLASQRKPSFFCCFHAPKNKPLLEVDAYGNVPANIRARKLR